MRQTATTGSTVAATDIDALMKAIAQQGAITPIASPQVLAMNNEPAIMRVGGAIPGADSSSGQHGEELTLTVVAQISADHIVQMHVSPSYASRTSASSSAALRVNEADTVVRVLDGETVVLSGFLNEREGQSSSVANQAAQSTRSQLVILLTPTIVRSAGLPH